MSHLFQDLEGVEVIVDDFVVWGEDVEQHDVRLRQVLDRSRESNLKLNKEKCHFRVPEVHYVSEIYYESMIVDMMANVSSSQCYQCSLCQYALPNLTELIMHICSMNAGTCLYSNHVEYFLCCVVIP